MLEAILWDFCHQNLMQGTKILSCQGMILKFQRNKKFNGLSFVTSSTLKATASTRTRQALNPATQPPGRPGACSWGPDLTPESVLANFGDVTLVLLHYSSTKVVVVRLEQTPP